MHALLLIKGNLCSHALTRFRRWLLVCACLVSGLQSVDAHDTRSVESNTIGWCNTFLTLRLSEKISLHGEYQWRRTGLLTDRQQSLLRTGVNFHLSQRLTVRAGYAWIETFPYGTTPINAFGKTFTEHRLYQAVMLQDALGRLAITQRWMLEQRWIGRYADAGSARESDYDLLGRVRYQLRLQYPLTADRSAKRFPYVAAFDELFIGFGEKVRENVFDQNRVAALIGYQFSGVLRCEAGWMQQLLQLGREVGGKNVFQNNQGFQINLSLQFSTQPKQAKP